MGSRYRRTAECVDCHAVAPIEARKLCVRCYNRRRSAGTLAAYPRLPQSGVDMVALTGATYRQIDYWARVGYLQPAVAGGSGVARQWSDDEIAVANRMARLVAIGIRPATAARVARGETDVGNGIRIEVDGG